MFRNPAMATASIIALLAFLLEACAARATAPPAPTETPQPTATITVTATVTSTPTRTPRPTSTPNLAETQKFETFRAEVESYFDQGYLATTAGSVKELGDFSYSWAQLGWYDMQLIGYEAADFFISGHFKWSSAYQNADISGCGYVFSLQENDDHYAIFLDRMKILFLVTSNHRGRSAAPTRGTGRVKFDNPADADFTVIVRDSYVYALVDGTVVGEYSLAQSRALSGQLALTVLSGTNKDYGTRCEMTNLHVWIPD